MPYPEYAQVDTNYTAVATGQGDSSFPGQQVDNDFANLKRAIDTLNTWVRALSRSDGGLGNQTVGPEQLKPGLVLGIEPPRAWEPATAYTLGNTTFAEAAYWMAAVDHVSSGSFSVDRSSGKWTLLIDFSAIFDSETALQRGLNLSDLDSAEVARQNLELPTAFLGVSGGNFTAGTARITGVGDPVGAQDVATKKWTDGRVGTVSVKDYGAVGDGVADDTTAITNAQSAASSAGLPLHLPAGTYSTTSNIAITVAMRTAAGAHIKPASGTRVSAQGFIEQDVGGGPLFDLSAGGNLQFSRQYARTLRISDFITSPDSSTDQSAAFAAALKALFGPFGYMTLDLEGRVIQINTNVSIVAGENGMVSDINSMYQRNKRIMNGKLRWGGDTDSADHFSDYMISIEAPEVNSSYLLLGLDWFDVVFDSGAKNKNLLRLAGYYEFQMDNCVFNDYGSACAVFLHDIDNDGAYVSGNGSLFTNCRWRGLESTAPNQPAGCPLRSYNGDIIVEGGNCDTSGPMDFHMGPVTVQNVHFSYQSNLTVMTHAIVIRDPREVVICNNDMDNCGVLITNEGYASYLPQNAETNWRGFHITGNKIVLNDPPDSGYGWCTFSTNKASTTVNGLNIGPNGFVPFTGFGPDSVAEFATRTPSPGSFSYGGASGLFFSSGAYGGRPAGGQFGPGGTTYFNATHISEAEVRTPRVSFTGDAGTGGGVRPDGSGGMFLVSSGTDRWDLLVNGNLAPTTDNNRNVGSPSNRCGTIYAGTGTINTSDEREKQQIGDIPDAWLDAWGRVPLRRFKFNDAVALKGDAARWHIGRIAQDIKAEFEADNLDPFEIGLLCYDEWSAEAAIVDAKGEVLSPAVEAGNRYGVRADECAAMDAAWLRRQMGAV